MQKKIVSVLIFILFLVVSTATWKILTKEQVSGAPPYGESESAVPETVDEFTQLLSWERPAGPAKVALQVGHWQNKDLPEELAVLRNNGGASGGGKTEVEVNLQIAELTRELLEAQGVVVEILPATVPPDYWADVFMAIHADGNTNSRVSGFKFAGPWRDFTRKSDRLVELLETSYQAQTELVLDPNVSRNMRGYYAFAWWRYEHSIHPMTTAVIAETGFLTNPSDRKIIVDQPELSATGLADGIINFLTEESLL